MVAIALMLLLIINRYSSRITHGAPNDEGPRDDGPEEEESSDEGSYDDWQTDQESEEEEPSDDEGSDDDGPGEQGPYDEGLDDSTDGDADNQSNHEDENVGEGVKTQKATPAVELIADTTQEQSLVVEQTPEPSQEVTLDADQIEATTSFEETPAVDQIPETKQELDVDTMEATASQEETPVVDQIEETAENYPELTENCDQIEGEVSVKREEDVASAVRNDDVSSSTDSDDGEWISVTRKQRKNSQPNVKKGI